MRKSNEKELKYIEKIDTYENESDYVKMCFSAMKMLAGNSNIVKNCDSENSSVVERNYVLSLVYSMGKSDFLRGSISFKFDSSLYFVGGETIKLISPNDIKMEQTRKALNFSLKCNKIEVIPDLVIHNSHNPKSGESQKGQFLVLEAKTTKRLGEYYFMRDLFKLNLYLSRLNFQNAVSLVINKPARIIDGYIETYRDKDYFWYDGVKEKLRLFIQEQDTPEMYKLKY